MKPVYKLIIVFCVIVWIGSSFSQVRPGPVLYDEPQYTGGRTNRLYWGPPSLAADPTIIAYEIQVQRDDTTFVDSLSIFPIPAVDVSDLSYEIGLGRTGSGVDRPLMDGVRYCYRMRFRYRIREEEFEFSRWSNIVCSTQDASPPELTISDLRIWTNTPILYVPFLASDRICRGVDKVKIYYRQRNNENWVLSNTLSFRVPISPVSDSIPFNSAEAHGDGYYEFYLAASDSLGNEYVPIPTDEPIGWTRFDTKKPFSSINPAGLLRYYNTITVRLNYSAGDTGYPSGIDSVIFYYTYQAGAPIRYGAVGYNGETSVMGEYSFVAPAGDGRYGIFTVARDSAGNYETQTDEEVFFFIDTVIPRVDGIRLVDTTSTITRFETFSEPNWTNSRGIFVSLINPIDPASPYASGIESVIVALDSAFTSGVMLYPYREGYQYIYELPDEDREIGLFASIVDRAGNRSVPRYGRIRLDRTAPRLISLRMTDIDLEFSDTTDSPTIRIFIQYDPERGAPYKVFLTRTPESFNSVPPDGWIDFRTEMVYTITGLVERGWIRLYAVCKDSAGNISNEVVDSIFYNPLLYKTVDLIAVMDPDGPDRTGRYTGNATIDVRVQYGRDIDSIAIWDDRGSPVYRAVWRIAGTETIVTLSHTLIGGDGLRRINVMGKSIYDPSNPTPVDYLEIVFDTYPPRLDSLVLRDRTSGFSYSDTSEPAYFGWTNKDTITVEILNPRDERTGIYRWKLSCEDLVVDGPFISRFVTFVLPGGDGSKLVSGGIQDSAGNWSVDKQSIIRLDRYRPQLDSIVIVDASTHDEIYTDTTYVLVKIFADDFMYGARSLLVALFEDSTLYPSRLNLIWRPYSPVLEYEFESSTVGVKRLYCAVKDSAGNISILRSDNIILSRELRVRIIAYDRTAYPPDSLYTNEPTVKIKFGWMGSTPDKYFISESYREAPEPYSPEWLDYPLGDTTLYTFTDQTEGRKKLYAWIRNPAGVVSPVDSTFIVLDMTPPEFVGMPVAFDTTTTERFPSIFKARGNWSNERSIKAKFGELRDINSYVDSIAIYGDIEGDTIRMAYNIDDTISLVLTGDSTRSSKILSFVGHDRAGNWGSARYPTSIYEMNFKLDLIPPEIRFAMGTSGEDSVALTRPEYLMVLFNDGPEIGYPASAYIWVSGFNETLYVEADSSWVSDENPRIIPVRFALAERLEVNRLYNINILMVDSAGNASNIAGLKLWVVPDTISLKLTLYDRVDTTDSEFTRFQTVRARIDTRIPAEYMMVSESRTFTGASWVPFTPVFDFSFSNLTNERKWVYCRIMQSGYVSVVDSASIVLDTIPPTYNGIVARGLETNDPNWSNTYALKVEPVNPYDEPPGELAGLILAEDSAFTVNARYLPFSESDFSVRYELTPQTETGIYGTGNKRTIYAKLVDKAENSSDAKIYTIIVDVEELERVSNFPNPFDPTKEVTYIRLKAPKGNENIRLKIYDQFGALVWSKEFKANNRLIDIEWDGKNDKGKIVANGGYICVVDIDGKTIKGKIGVWKGK